MMGFATTIKRNARRLSNDLAGTPDFFRQSPVSIALLRDLGPVAASYVRGRTLDAGAGRLAYRELLSRHAESVTSTDLTVGVQGVDVASDLERLPFAGGSFDTVFCSQVLEHVPDPWRAASEMARVLVPGGHLLLTVPLVGYLHNEPHDYHRFTPHGVRVLLERAGLEMVQITVSGGPLLFSGHLFATAVTGISYDWAAFGKPIFRAVTWLNAGVEWLDRRMPLGHIMPVNVLGVGRKR